MSKVFYPAIFHPEDIGFSVSVPDLDGCFSEGDTLEEAYEMINEAIGLYLDGLSEYPKPSNPKKIDIEEENDLILLVCFDPVEYAKIHNKKSVNRMVTVPGWLDQEAKRLNAPFSRILQDGLKEYVSQKAKPL
jgi:Uncharacterized conserved protein